MRRSFDVGAVVEALSSDDATVVAGAPGLDKLVSHARLATSPGHLRRVEAGDLLVTTRADLAASGEPWDDLAARLDAAGVSALVLGLADGDALPSELLRAADRLGLPVITVPPDAALPELASSILDALLDAQRRHLEEVLEAHATAVAEAEERFAAITLEELVSGHASGTEEIVERAASFGWDLTRPRAVLLASIDPPTEPGVLVPALATIAASARATLGPDAIVWRRSATIAALVAPAGDDPAERRRLAEGLRTELDHRLRTVTVSIGVGRRVPDPAALTTSFVEASRAVDVGRWAKGRHVTEVFDELGLERLLSSVPQDELADFVHHAIGPLHDHDRAHAAELVDTLAVWLETRNRAEAARRMHVHYNTLKNRLERIEAILGPVLDDPASALECQVAIHVARHYDVPWSEGPPG